MEPRPAGSVADGGGRCPAGTEEAPFATIERARDEVSACAPARPAAVTVSIHAGVHHLSGTPELDGAGRRVFRTLWVGDRLAERALPSADAARHPETRTS